MSFYGMPLDNMIVNVVFAMSPVLTAAVAIALSLLKSEAVNE